MYRYWNNDKYLRYYLKVFQLFRLKLLTILTDQYFSRMDQP